MFFCAISGEPPQDPVVSQKSGHVYERRLITKYIAENGTEPITGDKLEESDLITIQANPKTSAPRPPNLTSIPALLHTLQNEWDALVLETFALKQQYNSTRQELSHALYQQDAATRVAARLIRERDAAREALANVKATMGIDASGTGGDVEMADGVDEQGLPSDIIAEIDDLSKSLSSSRKKRKPPPNYPTAAQISTYSLKHTIPSLHASSPAGINSLALSRTQPSLFLTGGNDKIVQLYDRDAGKVAATLKGHTKKVHITQLREKQGEPRLVLSGSADKTARVWAHDTTSGEYAPTYTIKTHKGEITGVGVHPTQTLLALASADRTYSLHSLATFQPVFHPPTAGDDPYTTLEIHPDGALLALGTPGSTVQIYDVRSGKVGASLVPEAAGGTGAGVPFTVHTLAFSENGYHLMAPSSTSTVAIWDLRKQREAHTIELGKGSKLNKLVYDPSAQFLGIAGSAGATLYAHKTWEEVVKFNEGEEVVDLQFAQDGLEVWGISGREVRIWGTPVDASA